MRMKAMFQKWKEKILGNECEIKEQFSYITVLMAIFLLVWDTIASLFARSSAFSFLPMLLIDISLGAGLCLTLVLLNFGMRRTVFALLLATNLFLYPVTFFLSGGIEGSGGIWFVLGLVAVLMLFSGKAMYVLMLLTCFADIACYAISYWHPELVIPMESRAAAVADACQSMLAVSLAFGAAFKCSIRLQEKERVISRKREKDLEHISQNRSAFFASMSHEIRTPINTIIGLNEMILREKNLSEDVMENAANIHNASKMLLTIINDILDLSKIESGKMEIVPVQYETGAMFSDLVNLIWIRAHEKNLEFRLDIDEHIPSMLYGDEVRIKQVVTNILTNAVKYTSKGSVTLSVKSEQIDSNTVRLQISVEDTGMGIKKESMKDLFSSFQRIDQEKNRNIEGTGLGLSISKQLIEMMGGQIVVDSVYRMGSVFTVTVEQQIVNDKPLGAADFMARKKRKQAQYHQSFEAPDASVLVVDDNDMNLMVACKLLRGTKVHVDTASSGKECLQKTLTKEYHVIFMDHMMPEMDGEEALAEVRRQVNGHCIKTPVIALTANVMSGAEQIYQDMGFDGYLAKPISGALLEAILLKFLPDELIEYSAATSEADDLDSSLRILSSKRKKKICVTTDCICDLPEEWLERFDIKIMYYYVRTKEGRFCDVSEISSDNLLKYLKDEGNTAISEPASVAEYENFFAGALRESEKVIHISAGAGSSGGYEKAAGAADSFDNVTVIDSGHLTSGMGLMVLYAAQMAQDGHSLEEITARMAELSEKVSTTFILDTADSLYRNGRIHKRVKDLCGYLHLHPVLHMSRGKIKLLRFEAGKPEAAYKKYVRRQLRHRRKIDTSLLFISHAGCSLKELKKIQAEVEKFVKFDRIQIQKVSATVSANCGIGTMGLMFVRK